MTTNRSERFSLQTLSSVIYILAIAVSLLSFSYNGIIRTLAEIHPDFYVNVYAPGQLWAEGKNVYDYATFRQRLNELDPEKAAMNDAGFLYPPQAAVLFSIFARFPVETAHILVVGANLGLIVVCFGLLLRLVAQHVPIGLREVAFITWLLLNTAFARGNLRGGQIGILICVAILIPFVISNKYKAPVSGTSVALLSLKPNFMPFFAGYFVLRRAFVTLAICIVVAGLMTLLPLILTGRPIVESLTDWLKMLSEVSGPGRVNDVDPFAPGSALLIHLQPLVFRIFNTSAAPASIVSWIIILAVGGFSAFTIWIRKTADSNSELYDLAVISGLSLLAIYHRNYDIFLLFPALIYIFVFVVGRPTTRSNVFWSIFLVVILVVLALPGDLIVQFAGRFPQLNQNYLWRVAAPYQSWFVLAALAAVLWIYQQTRRAQASAN